MITVLKAIWNEPAAFRKLVVAIVGVLILVAAEGLLPGSTAIWVQAIAAVLTPYGVYKVPNKEIRASQE